MNRDEPRLKKKMARGSFYTNLLFFSIFLTKGSFLTNTYNIPFPKSGIMKSKIQDFGKDKNSTNIYTNTAWGPSLPPPPSALRPPRAYAKLSKPIENTNIYITICIHKGTNMHSNIHNHLLIIHVYYICIYI